MLSSNQDKEINVRIKKVVNTFLSNENSTIKDISTKLNIPSSTIQRDLNNIERITEIFGKDAIKILDIIKNKLTLAKTMGNIKGGIISTQNNIAAKDKSGRFLGSLERSKH